MPVHTARWACGERRNQPRATTSSYIAACTLSSVGLNSFFSVESSTASRPLKMPSSSRRS